jgi:lipid A ethanolaminephosphotransferase
MSTDLHTSDAPRKGWHPLTLSALASLWLVTAANLALWQRLSALPEVSGLRGLLFCLGTGAMVFGLLQALLSLLNWRPLLKPVLGLLLVSAASGAYFMMSYGIVIDATMIVNVLQTDPREAGDLLNWRLLVTLLVLAVLPLWWLWRLPVRAIPLGRRALGNAASLLVSVLIVVGSLLAIFQDFASVMRNHTQLRYLINPLNSLYAIGRVAAAPLQMDQKTLLPIGEDAQLVLPPGSTPATLVLVVGETARMGNFGINGYERNTTPRLQRESLVSLRNVSSCGTSTAASLPCMFSHLGREAFESRSSNHESLLDVLQRAGLAVLWIDNQSGCKGVCERVPTVYTTALKTSPWCDSGECHDEIMLQGLEERIAQLPAERRARGTVVVMHQMGSHGPAYHKRVPPAFKTFQPECTSNALQECQREQVVNAFDNTIVYTDHVLAETIGWLKRQKGPSAMVYLSDHGESLGENNLYLHGLPYRVAPEVQKRVPWITWLSPAFEKERQLHLRCLQDKVMEPLTHDHYFHSVLGLSGVQTQLYHRELDIYASCRDPKKG